MTVGRTRTTALAATLLVAGTLGLNAAAPASAQPVSQPVSQPLAQPAAPRVIPRADPDINDVRKQANDLYEQASQASERFNAAKIRLDESKTQLKALESDVADQQVVVDQMRNDVASLVVQQYQGNSLSTASQVVFSTNSQSFIDNLSAASSYNDQRGQVVDDYAVQLKRLTLRKQAANDQVAALTSTRTLLAKEKVQIDDKAAQAKAVLSKLEDKQRMALMAGVDPSKLGDLNYTGAAGAAIKFAMAQVGDAYVWGAVGPNAYDCSGLMMAAYRQAGISLPHSSRAQQGSGRPVSESDLKPGDLVFYYSPVSHVGMYIGNGLIVNAENPSVGVKVTGLHSMPYSGAVRPG